MSNDKKIGYLFLCSNSTEDECLKRMLFGGQEAYQLLTKNIQPGDLLFLYNYNSGRLHGEFSAISKAEMNLVPKAWEGKYPWQVKVRWEETYDPISKADFEHLIKFKKFPEPVLNKCQIDELVKIFKSTQRIPHLENEYRNKFPPKYLASDGHKVRSTGELTIDNWLFNQNICHGYEKKLSIKEEAYCDFFIRDDQTKECIYIEFWGMEDTKYLERKKRKIELYKKYNLKLVETNFKDLEAIDDILPLKLNPYLKKHNFN